MAIIDDIKSKVGSQGEESDFGFFQDVNTESNLAKHLEETENEDIIKMRKWWGYSVLLFIAIIVVFDITLVLLYGCKVLSFADSNVVIAVVVDGLLKIVGLGYLITKNIFEKIY